jgi:hypothetical protein
MNAPITLRPSTPQDTQWLESGVKTLHVGQESGRYIILKLQLL